MVIAALIIGAMTAYYLGIRNGLLAAGAATALFVVAAVVPEAALYAYAVVVAGIVGLVALGPGLRPRYGLDARAIAALRASASRLFKTLRR